MAKRVFALLLLLLTTGCSGTSAAETAKFCEVFDVTQGEFVDLSSGPEPDTPAEHRTRLEELKSIQERRKDAAPDELQEAFLTLERNNDLDSEVAARPSEEAKVDAASEEIGTFVDDNCGF